MFSERLKTLRKDNDLTQVSFASLFNVANGTVAMWETGKRQPDFETLVKLSNFFNTNIDYLLGRSDYNGPVSHSSSCWDGHHIRELRIQRNETPEDVAKSIGVPVENYKLYENAQLDPPVNVLQKLSAHFCSSIDFLLDYCWGIYDENNNVITGDFRVQAKEEQQLIEQFRLLDQISQGKVIGFIEALSDQRDTQQKSPANAG